MVPAIGLLDRVASILNRHRFCPKPDALTLLRAGWRLRVYEVATGRKLLDRPMTGDDQACPYVVMYGADKEIYASVSNRALVSVLRNLVNK